MRAPQDHRYSYDIDMLADAEFVEQLRFATQRYFDAIDAWEVAYQKYYRLPTHGSVSSDLEAEHSAYQAARAQLQRLVPNTALVHAAFTARPLAGAAAHQPGIERATVGRGTGDRPIGTASCHQVLGRIGVGREESRGIVRSPRNIQSDVGASQYLSKNRRLLPVNQCFL